MSNPFFRELERTIKSSRNYNSDNILLFLERQSLRYNLGRRNPDTNNWSAYVYTHVRENSHVCAQYACIIIIDSHHKLKFLNTQSFKSCYNKLLFAIFYGSTITHTQLLWTTNLCWWVFLFLLHSMSFSTRTVEKNGMHITYMLFYFHYHFYVYIKMFDARKPL